MTKPIGPDMDYRTDDRLLAPPRAFAAMFVLIGIALTVLIVTLVAWVLRAL